MNKNPELVLRLEGLILLRRGLACMGPRAEEAGMDFLNEQIDKLRRQLPGELRSRFDGLARRYTNTIVPISKNVCQGCDRQLSARLAGLVESTGQTFQCPHCGRFLFAQQKAPACLPLS